LWDQAPPLVFWGRPTGKVVLGRTLASDGAQATLVPDLVAFSASEHAGPLSPSELKPASESWRPGRVNGLTPLE
jgi:hypothetical protein